MRCQFQWWISRAWYFAAALTLALPAALQAQSLNGSWDAVITINGHLIPFTLEFRGSDGSLEGAFPNGDDRVTSTAGAYQNGEAHLAFDHYATQLNLRLEGDILTGTYGGKRFGIHPLQAQRHRTTDPAGGSAPDIGGLWDVPNESAKGEHAWRLVVRQQGSNVSAAILRVDGDTGALTGSYQQDKFLLSHFDGARAYLLEISPQPDGTLALALIAPRGGNQQLVAIRPAAARARGLTAPTDPSRHTRMRNPQEPFRFQFPDIDGKLVSNTDPRFQGKVVVVNVTGTWCPNCHDEAPFLQELYRKYRALGLEVVALDFEEAEQLQDLKRARSFIAKYGIEYVYLIAGEPAELEAKVPQAENLNSWPTTFVVGRDGRVRAIHAGFAAPASGEFYQALKKDFESTIETLLAEPLSFNRDSTAEARD